MRLADDTRGRIPFALLGVLLLVTSATVTTTHLVEPSRPADPAVDRAMREATATTQTALRDAVGAAARDAARNPVTHAAATPFGRVLNDSTTFRDALRLRVYLAASERLAAIRATSDGVVVRARLPAVDSPADLRAAKRRVHLSRSGPNGTALRVRIEGVQLRATDANRPVGEKRVDPTVTVASPVLELHDRVERFETRLDAGLDAPGFERRFTAGIYAVAWARGAAQYRGAPVANVVGNRHVALAANDAALGVQRATLGGADPEGDEALAAGWARALATDLAPGSIPGPVVEETLDRTERGLRRLDEGRREETVTVSPTAAADHALASLNESRVDRVVQRAYAADVRVVSAVSPTGRTVARDPTPGPNWTRVRVTTHTDRTVTPATRADAPGASVPDGWTAFRRYDRRVVARETTTARWRRGEETTTTRTVRTRTTRVSLAVVARHSPASRAPRRGVGGVYERGGALDGPNLLDVPSTALDRLVTARGGPDELARRAVGGTLDESAVRVVGERPAELRQWLRADVLALDRRVRNRSVTVSRADAGTYAVSPPARLANRLRANRTDLLDLPASYDGVAGKARVAVRRAYLDDLLGRLDARAADRAETRADLDESLGEHGSSLGQVRRSLDAATEAPRGRRTDATDGLGGPLAVSVDTAPSSLTLDPVAREKFGGGPGSVTPLDARNVNWVTVPYGAAAGPFADLLAPERRVSLRAAAGTLRASGHVPNGSTDEREALRGAVRDGVDAVRADLVDVLHETDACETSSDCRGVVAAGLSEWKFPAARALALANGSGPERVAAAAPVSATASRRLAATLRTTTHEALRADAARVPESAVSPVAEGNREVLREVAREVATSAGERATDRVLQRTVDRTLDSVPLGIPVAPVPGYWYATLNGWSVSVEGTYERLSVRSRRGVRDTVYVRDGSTVRLDVDDDGSRERLGTAPKVAFEASTTVVVVVPAGVRGVADVDGNRDERSPGYAG
ncbi:DUF7286 family protein [Halomarina rubra]|uniref:Uncharacterized protein n=1 Tax=Halomarina rubra TaxID=2071873 RepID=A0ABD6AVA3_9EURY|nr:hypothetical protein [Halomarina rubra]